jgi:hypothetical protein
MKHRLLLTAFFAMILTGAEAQNNQVLYYMNLPQNHLLNPALKPASRLYIGLPALTGINLNITNNFFNFSDVFTKGLEISKSTFAFLNPDFDRDKFLGKLKNLNYINPEVSVQLLGLGFTLHSDLYIFLDIIDNAGVNLVVPRDLFRLAFLGNEEFAGQTLDLSDMRADFNYYREIGIGASKNITPKLRFGAKAKLLFGITGGTFKNYAMNLTVNNDYTNTLEANMALDISGPVFFYPASDNKIADVQFDNERFNSADGTIKFLTNTKNPGFGLDIGAEYMVNDKIVLSASITDIGFIKWKSDLSRIEAVGNIQLSGLDFADIYEGNATIDDLAGNMADSIKNAFVVAGDKKPFTTKLPMGVTLAGKYNLNDKFSIGLLSYSRILGKQVKEALTVSANMNIGNKVSASLCYTACNNNYTNFGVGIGFRASVTQFYFLVDRIPLTWQKAGTSENSFPVPANWNTLNARFGMNLVFGNRARNDIQKTD